MEVTGWIHQFDQQPRDQDLVAEAVALGLDRVAVKALDGLPKERLGITYDPRVAAWPGFSEVVARVGVLQPQVYELAWLARAETGRPPGPSVPGTQHAFEPR